MLKETLKYLRYYWHKALIDCFIFLLVIPLAMLIRFDGDYGVITKPLYVAPLLVGAGIKTISLFWFRPFTTTWKHVSFYDAQRIFLTVTVATASWMSLTFLFFQGQLPRSIPIIDILVSLVFLFGVRVLRRYVFEVRKRLRFGRSNDRMRRVLVLGAGEAGVMLVREMKRHSQLGYQPIGILDDDSSKHGHSISNVQVFGTITDVAKWVEELNVDEVVFAIAALKPSLYREVIKSTEQLERKIRFKTIPAIVDLLGDTITVERIRDVSVEDLLGRKIIQLEIDSIKNLVSDKVILVSGAGGSIGSELVRQTVRFSPRKLILLGRGENSLYLIEHEIRDHFPEIDLEIKLADIQNKNRLLKIFADQRPDTVLHAAAHKHVPMIEANPTEAVFNNIIGTRNIVEASVGVGVKNFVNISTDKAVNPSSVMGASKHIAESIVFEAGKKLSDGCYVSVRFGNVLGSRGSVIPLFKKQIRLGGPVTVTHRDMIRYFMTIPEAAQLVLQAAAFGQQGKLYVLDMGDPVKIFDLARDLIRLSGLELGRDIDIEFTGIRPGEKLFEELSFENEDRKLTKHSKIFEATKLSIPELENIITILHDYAMIGSDKGIRTTLQNVVEGANITLVID